MRAEIRHPLAYCTSGILGTCVLKGFTIALGRGSDWGSLGLEDVTFEAVTICLLMLPFWIAFSVLAAHLRLQHLVVYIVSGAILGVFVGTFYGACITGMVFVSGPDLDFTGRGLRTLRYSGITFATAGGVACACYWLLAIRGRSQSNASPFRNI
ncbi:MAG: hypothetical protein ACRYG8_38725 [Janthinobacterium lividum]